MKGNREKISWAMYDWANSAFATTVMAGFFPLFFKKYWSAGSDVSQSTFQLGLANSIAGLLVVFLAPILGAIADQGAGKKKFLLFFLSLGAATTAALFLVELGQWQVAVFFYILSVIGFSGGNVFYDSLITLVAKDSEMDRVSALGFAMGYLGGGILFAINVWMTLKPSFFGFPDAAAAVKFSFLMVAAWWTLFSIPLFLYVEEPPKRKMKSGASVVFLGFKQLYSTFKKLKHLKVVSLFLAAYWLYIDGVDTIIRMAVDYGLSLGFSSDSLIVALLITQFVGFPAAILFGRVGEKFGTKEGIYLALGVYIFVTIFGYFMKSESEFYVLAIVIGLVQGGIQSLSRSLYARIIPKDYSAEFFGFYNMMGKFAAVIGPTLVGVVSLWTGSSRLSILSIIVLFILGGFFLRFVEESEGVKEARRFKTGPL